LLDSCVGFVVDGGEGAGRIAAAEVGRLRWLVYGLDRWLEVVVAVVAADLGMETAVVERVEGLVGLGLGAAGVLDRVKKGGGNNLVVHPFVEAVAEGVESVIAPAEGVAVVFVRLEVHIVMLRMRRDLALDVVTVVLRGRRARHRCADRDCCTLKDKSQD